MKQLPDIEQIECYIDKIATNEIFSSSTQLVELLRLLIEESLAGNQLKELTLGIKFFGEKYAEKDNGTARVYVYNLRKKLNAYYADQGEEDRLKFILEKGSYKIRFEQSHSNDNHKKTIFTKRTTYIAAAIAVIIVACVALFMQPSNENYCWDNFLRDGANNTCVLADHITINYNIDSVKCVVSHPKITNETLLRREVTDSVSLTQFTYFSKDIPYSLFNLTKWFTQSGGDMTITQESKLDYAETKRSNIIYIGSYKTMGVSKHIFDKNNEWAKIDYNTITIDRGSKQTIYRSKFQSNYTKTYAIVSFFALNEQRHAIYFVSNSDVGTMAAVSYFTNREHLNKLYESVPKDSYFNALFEVEGVGRTNANCRLIDIELTN